MGFNPRYRLWTRENWQGYAPTIGDMARREWSLTLHCNRCRFATRADPDKIIRLKGRSYSPWGRSARCPALHCGGRMFMRAYAPGPNETIEI